MVDIIRPIEPFELTQGFGENPDWYTQFGLKAHNGWDIKTIYSDTPQGRRNILSSWFSTFYTRGTDPTGYGRYFETIVQLYNTWKLTFAHCHSIEDFSSKNEGDMMAISDNTGNSTGPHLHLTVKKGKLNNGAFEVFDYQNGYFGALDPQIFFDELRQFKQDSQMGDNPCQDIANQLEEMRKSRDSWREKAKKYEANEVVLFDEIEKYKQDIVNLDRSVQLKNEEIDIKDVEIARLKSPDMAKAIEILLSAIFNGKWRPQ